MLLLTERWHRTAKELKYEMVVKELVKSNRPVADKDGKVYFPVKLGGLK